MTLLWRDPWLKPLSDYEAGSDRCGACKKAFGKADFVTSCEFCEIGIMHSPCADKHIVAAHAKELAAKINAHKDKPLHDYQ